MEQIEQIRQAVADALEQGGHPNRQFLEEIRTGRRDDSPYIHGAVAWATYGPQPSR